MGGCGGCGAATQGGPGKRGLAMPLVEHDSKLMVKVGAEVALVVVATAKTATALPLGSITAMWASVGPTKTGYLPGKERKGKRAGRDTGGCEGDIY